MSQLAHTVIGKVHVRLILLQWGTRNVTIEITSVPGQHTRNEFLELAQPVLDSLRFEA